MSEKLIFIISANIFKRKCQILSIFGGVLFNYTFIIKKISAMNMSSQLSEISRMLCALKKKLLCYICCYPALLQLFSPLRQNAVHLVPLLLQINLSTQEGKKSNTQPTETVPLINYKHILRKLNCDENGAEHTTLSCNICLSVCRAVTLCSSLLVFS